MNDILGRAEKYRDQSLNFSHAHYDAAKKAAKRHSLLGIPVVITTTVITTSIFASLNNAPSIGWKITAGIISLFSAVLSALQIFFKFSELAEKHKAAGTRYRSLRRQLDIFKLRYADMEQAGRKVALEELTEIANQFAEIAETSPSITVTQESTYYSGHSAAAP